MTTLRAVADGTGMQKTYRLIVDPTVEAVPINKDTLDWAAGWCKGVKTKDGIVVPTLYGMKKASINESFLVKTRSGDFRVEEITDFLRRYELVHQGNK